MSSMSGGQGYGQPWKEKKASGYNVNRVQQYTPEQMQLLDQSMGNVGPNSITGRLAAGDQSYFDEIEQPAMRQFSELQGGLASRFSQGGGGQGALGARKSSGFQNKGTAAASNFAQSLQANRLALTRQAIQDLHGMSSDLLNKRPYETSLTPKAEGTDWMGIGGAFLGGASGFLGGGYDGALAGASTGYNIGSGGKGGGNTYNFGDQGYGKT